MPQTAKRQKKTRTTDKVLFARDPRCDGQAGFMHCSKTMYLAGPDNDEDVVGNIPDEDDGGGVAELTTGERVDSDAFQLDQAEKF